MPARGETDLVKMLASLAVTRRDGVFTFVAVREPTPELVARAHGVVREADATTLVLPVDIATDHGLPVTVEMAWLTLTIQSSLEAVGLTAAFSRMLGDAGIPCNVLAGHDHDHILVPVPDADAAVAVLTAA